MFRIVSLLIGYVFGCFQTAFILGKLRQNIDIREYGSGNSGTTNAIRVMGWKFGVLTFVLDNIKAVFAVILVGQLFNSPLAGFFAGLGVILGHNWPIFLKFRGGKGIASTIGVMLAFDYRIGLINIAIMLVTVLLTKYVSLGSILLVVSIPILIVILQPFSIEYLLIGLTIMILALYRHKANIKRLLSGTENKIGHKKDIVNK